MVQALSWFGDAMVDHAETFWSLFAVDMDALMEIQPEDTWDSFPLFQMLNNYLRTHGKVFSTFCIINSRCKGSGTIFVGSSALHDGRMGPFGDVCSCLFDRDPLAPTMVSAASV